MTKHIKRSTINWRWPSSPISDEPINALEMSWGIHFPTDYVECAKQNHGGYPDRKCFDFSKRKEAVFSRLLSFTPEGKKTTLAKTYESVKDRMPVGVFPFAEDPFGNLLCFDYRIDPNHPQVVFWDHERSHTDPIDAVTRICDTFSTLIASLYEPA